MGRRPKRQLIVSNRYLQSRSIWSSGWRGMPVARSLYQIVRVARLGSAQVETHSSPVSYFSSSSASRLNTASEIFELAAMKPRWGRPNIKTRAVRVHVALKVAAK